MRGIAVVVTLALAAGCGAVPDDELVDGDVGDVAVVDDGGDDGGDDGSADATDDVDVVDGARDAAEASVDASRDAGRDAAGDVARDGGSDVPRDVARDVARDVGSDAGRDAGAMDGGACPEGSVLVGGRVCVDRYEGSLESEAMDGGVWEPWSPYNNPGTRRVRAVSREGVVPQGYITGEQAQTACRNAGRRLCTSTEWSMACRGPTNQTYPYGNTYVRRRCNEGRTPHPVVQFYGTSVGVFTFERMNNPGINMQADTVAPTGAFSECESPWGIFDMVGNLHEWIADTAGTFKGGFYVDAEINGHGCLYTTTAHNFTYRDYSTGFRCCADPE